MENLKHSVSVTHWKALPSLSHSPSIYLNPAGPNSYKYSTYIFATSSALIT